MHALNAAVHDDEGVYTYIYIHIYVYILYTYVLSIHLYIQGRGVTAALRIQARCVPEARECAWRCLQARLRQYVYFCASKASKLSTLQALASFQAR